MCNDTIVLQVMDAPRRTQLSCISQAHVNTVTMVRSQRC